MWRIKAVLFFMVWSVAMAAQKNDYHWLQGYDYLIKQDSLVWGINHLNFNNKPFTITRDSLAMDFTRTNTTISDDTGALLFYTNGIYIANKYHEKIAGSDSMNAGYVSYIWDPDIAKSGYRTPQGIIALPQPDSPHIYHLIHSFTDTIGTSLHVPKILETVLDTRANNGHGKVLRKNVPLLEGGQFGSCIKATKHANGKDWWIVVQKMPNIFEKLLLTSKGIEVDSPSLAFGVDYLKDDIEVETFSSDGSKFVYLAGYLGLAIFDFNRCNGELSNRVYIPLPIIKDSTWIGIGVEISPNNRYLYVSMTKRIYQYDLQASDIAASAIKVAQYDGFFENYPAFQTNLCTQQLAPDGKIYLNTGNGTSYYHVIENPNLGGMACNVRQHGIKLTSYCNGIPNYPNYRLGAQQCYGVGISPLAPDASVSLYPNPANSSFIVDYGSVNWSAVSELSLSVYNVLGAEVYQVKLGDYTAIHKVDVSSFASGMYVVSLKNGGERIWQSKVIKE